MSNRNFVIKTVFAAVDKSSRVIGGIQAKVVKFSAGAAMHLRKIERVTSSLSSGLTTALKFGAAAGAGALGLVFHAVNKTAESMDALAKKTRAIGFPIEEFQEWRFAAEQSGVSSEVFGKGIEKFTKTMGELKGRQGALYTYLKKTDKGLMNQLKNTDDVSKAFELYMQAIEKTPGAMDKAALASAAFGRSGVSMINLANAGAEEIGNLRNQMRENGIVTADQAAKAEAYNDMMNRLKLTVSGFMVDVLTPLMPKIMDLADATRQWLVENRGIIKSKISSFFSKLPAFVKGFADSMRGVLPLLSATFSKIRDLAEWVSKVDWGKWLPIITKAVAAFYAFRIAIRATSTTMDLFNTAMNLNLGPAKKAAGFFAKDMPSALGKSVGAAGKLQTTFGVLAAAAASWEIGTAIYENFVAPLIEAQDKLDKLTAEVADTMGRDKSKRSTAQLNRDMAKVNDLESSMDTGFAGIARSWLPDITGAFGAFDKVAQKSIGLEKGNIRAELEQRAIAAEFSTASTDAGPISTMAPASASVPARTEQVVKHQVEMTINDAGGRTKTRSGRTGPGFKLKHTGAAI